LVPDWGLLVVDESALRSDMREDDLLGVFDAGGDAE
jgi:hypothetical protein